MAPCLSIELLWEELMWATHDGWMDKSFLTSQIHYKEFYRFQPHTFAIYVQINHFFNYWCNYPWWHHGENKSKVVCSCICNYDLWLMLVWMKRWKHIIMTCFRMLHCTTFQGCTCLGVFHLKFLKNFHNIFAYYVKI